MSILWAVYKQNYDTKTNTVMKICTDKREALQILQNTVVHFIQDKDGNKKLSEYADFKKCLFDESVFSVKKEQLENGCYIVQNMNDSLYKWTIWEKYYTTVVSKGVLYNSKYERQQWRRIFSVDLTELDYSKIVTVRPIRLNYDDYVNNKVHDELVQIKAFKRIHRLMNESKPVSLVQIRAEFSDEFNRCPLAVQGSIPVGPKLSDVMSEMKEKHAEMASDKKPVKK